MAVPRNEASYRDKLVSKIKLAGQELIDRADSLVAEDLDMIGDFDIWVNIPADGSRLIDISVTTKIACKNELKLYAININE